MMCELARDKPDAQLALGLRTRRLTSDVPSHDIARQHREGNPERPAPDLRELARQPGRTVEGRREPGCAVLQGVPITTIDLDVVHRRTPENVARLLEVFHNLDATMRYDLAQRGLRPTAKQLASRPSCRVKRQRANPRSRRPPGRAARRSTAAGRGRSARRAPSCSAASRGRDRWYEQTGPTDPGRDR